MRHSDPALFFSVKEKTRIISAIQEAEKRTSGEIRVHLQRQFKSDIMAHAAEIFSRLGMTHTGRRNGVLILLGLKSKRFVVLGDRGIHKCVPDGFWNDVANIMSSHFKEDRFADGIAEAVREVGKRLAEHFPYDRDDMNELPDEISYSL